jgi:hypothetical protein
MPNARKSKAATIKGLYARVKRVGIVTLCVLMIPLVLMQFSDEMQWGTFDFVIFGILLMSVGFLYAYLLQKVTNVAQRVFLGVLILIFLLLVWAELAVGVFGTPFAGS